MCESAIRLAVDGLISVFLASCPAADWSGDLFDHLARTRYERHAPAECGPGCLQVLRRQQGTALSAVTIIDLRQFELVPPKRADEEPGVSDAGRPDGAARGGETQYLLRSRVGGRGDLQGEIIILMPVTPPDR